jgi:hypothetical protein
MPGVLASSSGTFITQQKIRLDSLYIRDLSGSQTCQT